MGRIPEPMLWGLTVLALSSCNTEPCDCPPAIVPGVVTGHVVLESGAPVAGAIVQAYSDVGAGCESPGLDFGLEVTQADGSFALGLATGFLQEDVCVLVFARPPEGVPLEVSDTMLLIMDFRDETTQDSAQVELVLRPS